MGFMEWQWEDEVAVGGENEKPDKTMRNRSTSFRKKDKVSDTIPFLKRGHSLDSIETKKSQGPNKNADDYELNDIRFSSTPRNSDSKLYSAAMEEFRNRKKSPKLKEFKRRLSRGSSKENQTTKFCFGEVDNSNMDPRIDYKISLFYLSQQLPEEFPFEVLHFLFTRYNSVAEVQKLLVQRGWELKVPYQENSISKDVPSYYFGTWSYDCWSIFEGAPNGSFITCHKENRYYIVYKGKSGKIVLRSMRSGPELSNSLQKKFNPSKGLIRPPKRYVCQKCCQSTPCMLIDPVDGHKSELSKFVLSYPVMFNIKPK